MIGLLYFLFFTVYLIGSIWVIRIAYRFAKSRYKRGWVGGWLAAFVMYNLVFWDWIPVLLMHKYYCATEAGFWVYKTPEQWVKEHPEVVGQDWSDQSKWKYETLNGSYEYNISRNWIASSVYEEVTQTENVAHAINKSEEKIVDAKSGQVLVKSVNFHRGSSFHVWAGEYKLWLSEPFSSCSLEARDGVSQELFKLIKLVKGGKQ